MELQLFQDNAHSIPSRDDIWNWYHNVQLELAAKYLDASQQAYLSAYYNEAGLLHKWRRSFFRRHYAEPFGQALTFLLDSKHQPLILDLGCGTGTQSLAFALCGASVVALDLDTNALSVLERRKQFYEEKTGKTLNITTCAADVFDFDLSQIPPIDGLYSLFAFNLMQPTAALLGRLAPRFASQARIAVQDGNRLSWLSHLPGRRRQVLSPLELDQMLTGLEFTQVTLEGGVSIPPPAWAVLPYDWLSIVDSTFNQTWFWPISYLAMYQGKR
jgi:SAM-dependent methyltransferase